MELEHILRSVNLLALIALVINSRIIVTSAVDDFYDAKIQGLGTNVQLYCDNFTSEAYNRPNNSQPMAWMLPDLRVLYSSSADGKYLIQNDNWTLAIKQTAHSDLGLYHCMLLTEDNDWYLVRLGLNARGPYYKSLWDQYRQNTITGLCVAGGWLVLVGLTYVACKLPCLSTLVQAFNSGGADDWGESSRNNGLYTVGKYTSRSEFNHIDHSVELSEKQQPQGSYNAGFERGAASVSTNIA